jgi:hypothetical protein
MKKENKFGVTLSKKDYAKISILKTSASNDYEIVSLNGRVANIRPISKEGKSW